MIVRKRIKMCSVSAVASVAVVAWVVSGKHWRRRQRSTDDDRDRGSVKFERF